MSFIESEDGVTAIEYGVFTAFVGVFLTAAWSVFSVPFLAMANTVVAALHLNLTT